MLDTDEGGASWASVKPKSDRILIGSAIDGLYKDIMSSSFCGFKIKISGIDAGIIGKGIALYVVIITGMVFILSSLGAATASQRATSKNPTRIIIDIIQQSDQSD